MHPAPYRAPGFVRGALAAVMLAAPFAAGASVVGFDLAATVNTRSASPANPALDLPPEIALGAEVTARIRYETIAVDTNPSPGRGEYNGVIREFLVRVDGLEFFLVPELPGASNFAVVRNDYLPPGSSTPADSFGLFGLNGWPPFAPPGATFQLSLTGMAPSTALDSDALVDDMRRIDNWLVFWAIYTGPTLHSSATAIVTSLRPITDVVPVPEPAAPALLLVAAAALLGKRRKPRVTRSSSHS
jgi:hypothetical protein